MLFKRGLKGQVWVETVIYTLIGLAVIGILLAVAKPKIDEIRDRMAIEQSLEAFQSIDNLVREVMASAQGNKRSVELKISDGVFVVDSPEDELRWVLDSSYAYSDVGSSVFLGNINVTTSDKKGEYEVSFVSSYNDDLKFEDEDVEKRFEESSIPYKIFIENEGVSGDERVIDFSE